MTPPENGSTSAFTLKQKIGLVLGPLLFTAVFFFSEPAGMSAAGRGILASTLWIAAWWVTEAIPIAATSLLPLVLFPLTGGLGLSQTSSAYGHRIIFLFLGGFIIAVAIERWGLHRRFALNIIKAMGTATRRIILGFMIATGVLSMWISNTAAALMMLPIGLAVIRQLSAMMRQQGESEAQTRFFGKALMLSIAYSASIGGMATLIGTPPNGILAGQVAKLYQVEIGFAQWMTFGLPVSIILLALSWIYLAWFAFPLSKQEIPGSRGEITQQLRALGKMSREEFSVLLVFALTALCWISRGFVLDALIPGINDTTIAIAGAVALFLIPAKSAPGKTLLDWEHAVQLPWGIILLFGAGFSLAEGFMESGLAEWIGSHMTLLEGVSYFLVLLVIIALINFLTEVTSNTATTTMILPILASFALALDAHPFGLMGGACLAASCAFMLPVATPPNAVVFGSGHVEMADMVKAGFWMNLLSILILSLLVYFLMPLLWGIDLQVFPAGLK